MQLASDNILSTGCPSIKIKSGYLWKTAQSVKMQTGMVRFSKMWQGRPDIAHSHHKGTKNTKKNQFLNSKYMLTIMNSSRKKCYPHIQSSKVAHLGPIFL